MWKAKGQVGSCGSRPAAKRLWLVPGCWSLVARHLVALLGLVVLGLAVLMPWDWGGPRWGVLQGVPDAAAGAEGMVPVRVRQVVLVDGQPAVWLTAEQGQLLIYIDYFMAQSIQMGLTGASVGRPLTHDLMGVMIRRLGGKLNRVSITNLRQNTYFASITLMVNGDAQEIDARPSDALALAVRQGVPVWVKRDLIQDLTKDLDQAPGPDSALQGGNQPPEEPLDSRKHGA